MAKMPHNIEKSAFRRGEYVGYGDGVYRIERTNRSYGCWVAFKQDEPRAPAIYAFTLARLSEKLEFTVTRQSIVAGSAFT